MKLRIWDMFEQGLMAHPWGGDKETATHQR